MKKTEIYKGKEIEMNEIRYWEIPKDLKEALPILDFTLLLNGAYYDKQCQKDFDSGKMVKSEIQFNGKYYRIFFNKKDLKWQ